MNDTLPIGLIQDPEDHRDFFAEHILGVDESQVPDKIQLFTKANNQGDSVKCTAYACYHVAQILNEIEHKMKIQSSPDWGWDKQKTFGTYVNKVGDSLSTALKSIVKFGMNAEGKVYPVNGYAKVSNSEVKYWLSKKMPVVTGMSVTSTNFKKAKYEGVWGGLDGSVVSGHAVAIIGYDDADQVYTVLNSYGPDWGFYGNGTFKVKYTDLVNLWSKYVIYDAEDLDFLFKDLSSNSWAYEAVKYVKEEGLMKGYEDGSFRPNQALTRAEMAQILYNLKK